MTRDNDECCFRDRTALVRREMISTASGHLAPSPAAVTYVWIWVQTGPRKAGGPELGLMQTYRGLGSEGKV